MKTIVKAIFIMGFSLTLSVGYAEEFLVIPNVFISSRNFEYSVGKGGGVSGQVGSVGLGLTGIKGDFYLDIAGEKTPSPTRESTTGLFTDIVEFERSDIALSLGYAINDSITTFMGYKYGKTTIVGTTSATQSSPLSDTKISLEGEGPFIGAGGVWPVRKWGYLSFSAAYAKMTTTYQDVTVSSTKGNASGTSLSIKWKAPLLKNLFYDLSLIRHDYYYEDFKQSESDISEEILSFRLGLSYQF